MFERHVFFLMVKLLILKVILYYIQWSGVAVNGAAALLLIPISVFFLKENLSLQKVSGIVFTLLGLYLLSQKS
jgi:drug/metabolite transporter (DMT)-like permease